MAGCRRCRKSSGVSSGPDGVAPVSSDFRISIAPVSISVAVLVGAGVSDIIVTGGGWHHRLVVRRGNVMGCQQQLQQTGSITRLTLTCLGVIRQQIGKRQFLSPAGAVGASSAISMAAAGSSGLPSSLGCMCWAWVGRGLPRTSCCGVCIIANRLANNARVSASAPRFNPGVSPFGERFGPAPSASIVFISMPHSLVTTGAKPVGKDRNSCRNAAKRVPELSAVQSSAAAAWRHGSFEAGLAGKLAGQVIRLAAFDSARMLVPCPGCIAAMARHLFRKKFGPVGNGLQLFMNLIAIPAGGPQMTDGCLTFRHRHAARPSRPAGRERWPRGQVRPGASSPPLVLRTSATFCFSAKRWNRLLPPAMISHPSTRQGRCGWRRTRPCQRRSAGSVPSAAARCRLQGRDPDPGPAYSRPSGSGRGSPR